MALRFAKNKSHADDASLAETGKFPVHDKLKNCNIMKTKIRKIKELLKRVSELDKKSKNVSEEQELAEIEKKLFEIGIFNEEGCFARHGETKCALSEAQVDSIFQWYDNLS